MKEKRACRRKKLVDYVTSVVSVDVISKYSDCEAVVVSEVSSYFSFMKGVINMIYKFILVE